MIKCQCSLTCSSRSISLKLGVYFKFYFDDVQRLLRERKSVFATDCHWFIVIWHLYGSVIWSLALMLLLSTDVYVDEICFVKPCKSDTIVQWNSQHHKTLRSFIITGHILLLKYYVFYPSIGIEPKIGKYRVLSNLISANSARRLYFGQSWLTVP